MIEYFAIRNYMSYRDRTELSFVASNKEEGRSDGEFAKESWYKLVDGKRLLRLLIGVGLNGTGKSKLMDAIIYLKRLATVRPVQPSSKPAYMPFMLDDVSQHEPTECWLSFYIGETNYLYYIRVSAERIEEEELRVAGARTQRVYLRTYNTETGHADINFGMALDMNRSDQRDLEIHLWNNASVLSTFGSMNLSSPLLRTIYDYMENQISMVQKSGTQTLADRLSTGDRVKDEMLKERLLELLHNVGTNIVDYEVEQQNLNLMEELNQVGIPQEVVQTLMQKYIENQQLHQKKTLRFVHQTSQGRRMLNSEVESVGTLNIVRILLAYYDVVLGHKTTCLDEIEYGLHTMALEFILKSYLAAADDCQLLVATHDLQLLRSPFLRRDAIRMFSKNEEGVTDVRKPEYLHNTVSFFNKYTSQMEDEVEANKEFYSMSQFK